jgi:hypothetical protein
MRSAGRIATIGVMLAGQMLVAAAFAQSPDDSRVLCKQRVVSNTRLPQARICRTNAEWAEIEKQRERRGDGEVAHREGVMSQPMRPASPQ